MKTTLRLTLLLTLCCLVAPLVQAAPGEMKFKLNGPIVIGDQVFDGEVLGVSMFGHRGMVAISIDGKRTALMYKSSRGQLQRGLRGIPVFVKDAQGNRHLTGISWRRADDRTIAFSEMRVAAVDGGSATVAPVTLSRRLAANRK